MARHIVGAAPEALIALRETVRRMLKENGPPPQGEWAEFAVLEPVRDLPSRHAATLLTFDAVAEALGKVDGAAAAGRSGRRERSMNAFGQAPRRAAHLLIRFYN